MQLAPKNVEDFHRGEILLHFFSRIIMLREEGGGITTRICLICSKFPFHETHPAVSRICLCSASPPCQNNWKKTRFLPAPNGSSVQKHAEQTKESLKPPSKPTQGHIVRPALCPLASDRRCLSSDSVQSTRQVWNSSRNLDFTTCSSFAPPEEAQSTSKSVPQLLKSSFLFYLDLKCHRTAQKGFFFLFITTILAVAFASYFLEPLLSVLSQLLRKQNWMAQQKPK